MNTKLTREEIINQSQEEGYRNPVMMCHTNDCCPTVSFSDSASEDKQVKVTDDFGNQIYMSKDQWRVITELAAKEQLPL